VILRIDRIQTEMPPPLDPAGVSDEPTGVVANES